MKAVEEAVIVPDAANWQQAWSSGEAPPPECHSALIDAILYCTDVKHTRILEVGAGTGRDNVELSTLGAEVYALDFTAEALTLTQQLSDQQGSTVRLVCADTLRLPFASGSFDLLFSQGLLEHFSDPYAVVQEQARVIRPGGYLLVDVPQKYSFYTLHKRRFMRKNAWFAGWETEFSLSELIDLLQSARLQPVHSYGHGYFPSPLLGIRNLHTFDQRHHMPLRMLAGVRQSTEQTWQKLEAARWFHRWLTNIGVIAQKL